MVQWIRIVARMWLAARGLVLAQIGRSANQVRNAVVLSAACLIAACGGGSGDPEGLPIESLTLVGTASAETAISGAAVSVRCASGPTQTVTAGDGSFSVSIRSGALPCMIEVSSGGRIYRSLVVGTGSGTFRVNANPLTELVVARIASTNGSTPAALYAGFGSNNTAINLAALEAALAYLRVAFAALVDLTGTNPVTDVLVATSPSTSANALGTKVSGFLTQVAAANSTLEALVLAVLASPANTTPLMPTITVQPVPASVEAPQAASFSVQASSALPPSYQWQLSTDSGATFVDIAGATGAGHAVPTTQITDTGRQFRVRVQSAGGTVTSSAAALSVTAPAPTAPVISTQPQSISAPYGQPAAFSVAAYSIQSMSYQWRRNGVEIAGATDPAYTVPMTVPGDNGATYTVVVANDVGATLSAAATLTVIGIPAATPNRVAAGASHSVTVGSDGTVTSWGNIQADIGTSLSGLMGVGNEPVVAGARTVARTSGGTLFGGVQTVTAGQWSTLVLRTDGTLWGWGYSGWGNLGNSTAFAFEQKSPVQVRMADGSPLTSVTQVAAGSYSTSMAVTADGTVWGWGQNRYGQLGIGLSSETGQTTPVAMLSPTGTARFSEAVQVAPGISHAAILRRDGTVYTVGWGNTGALGDGSTANRTLPGRVETAPNVPLANVVSIAAGSHFYIAVTAEGTAYAWGANGRGQLGDGTVATRNRPVLVRNADGKPMTGIVAAAAGTDFAMFVKADGTVWAVGNNDIGQLGTNSTAAYVANPALVKDASGAVFGDVVSVSALHTHTVVRRSDGSVWAWGSNEFLQLGDMTTTNRRNPIRAQ